MFYRTLLAIVLFFGLAVEGRSMTVKQFREQQGTTLVRIYLHGVGEGSGWANASLQSRDYAPLFCQPGTFVLTADNYVQLVGLYVEKPPAPLKEDTPIELLLLEALKQAYPCKP